MAHITQPGDDAASTPGHKSETMNRVDGVWGLSGARALGWGEEGERGCDGRGGEVIVCAGVRVVHV
jgi:hypothetical protein